MVAINQERPIYMAEDVHSAAVKFKKHDDVDLYTSEITSFLLKCASGEKGRHVVFSVNLSSIVESELKWHGVSLNAVLWGMSNEGLQRLRELGYTVGVDEKMKSLDISWGKP